MTDDRLPDELARLYQLDRARSLDAPPDAARAAIAARLAPLLVGPPAGGGGGGGSSGGPPTGGGARTLAAKGVALLATGAVVGSLATLALRPPRHEVRTVTVEVERRVEVPVFVDRPSAVPAAASGTAPPPANVNASSAARATSAGGDPTLARERVLLEGARSALARRDPGAALAATDTHVHEFPRGRLVEEREALAIQALVLAGRSDEAATRASRFRRRFPGGLFLPVVDSAVEGLGEKK